VAYQRAVLEFGLSPTDFWNMDPVHFWWLVEARDDQGEASKGALSEADKRELLDVMVENGFTW
jgi:hypothetical protein